MCKYSTEISVTGSRRVGRIQFNSWSILSPVPCGISHGVLSKFREADWSSWVSTDASLVLSGSRSVRSPWRLPFLIPDCKRSGCLSDNTWASSSTRGAAISSLATLLMSDSARLPRVLLFWTCHIASSLWICHQRDQCHPHHNQITKALCIISFFSSC